MYLDLLNLKEEGEGGKYNIPIASNSESIVCF